MQRRLVRTRFGRALGRRTLTAASAAAMLGACDWDWPNGGGTFYGDQPLPVLQPRYVLTSVSGLPLPYTLTNGATRTRLIADTLIFSGAGTPPGETGTYQEIRTIGVQEGTGAEVVTRTTSLSRAWRRGTTYSMLLVSDFPGLPGGVAEVSVYLGNAMSPNQPVYFNVATGSYAFEPR